MKDKLSKSLKSQFFYLGLYQLIGGIAGILLIVWAIVSERIALNGNSILLLAPFFLLFNYSIYCGLNCFDFKKSALKHSLINQALQVLHFFVAGFGFGYSAGIYLNIGIDTSSSESLIFDLGVSIFNFQFNSIDDFIRVSINLVAIGMIYWLRQIMKKLDRETELLLN